MRFFRGEREGEVLKKNSKEVREALQVLKKYLSILICLLEKNFTIYKKQRVSNFANHLFLLAPRDRFTFCLFWPGLDCLLYKKLSNFKNTKRTSIRGSLFFKKLYKNKIEIGIIS